MECGHHLLRNRQQYLPSCATRGAGQNQIDTKLLWPTQTAYHKTPSIICRWFSGDGWTWTGNEMPHKWNAWENNKVKLFIWCLKLRREPNTECNYKSVISSSIFIFGTQSAEKERRGKVWNLNERRSRTPIFIVSPTFSQGCRQHVSFIHVGRFNPYANMTNSSDRFRNTLMYVIISQLVWVRFEAHHAHSLHIIIIVVVVGGGDFLFFCVWVSECMAYVHCTSI